MESVAEGIEAAKKIVFETFGVKCPECGANLYRPKTFNKKGEKIPGACMDCGYREPLKDAKRRTMTGRDLTISAYMNDAYKYLNSNSILSTFNVFDNKFDNYITRVPKERQALEYAKEIARKMASGEKVHAILLGSSGSGKTHLATGIMYDYLKRKKYLNYYTDKNGDNKTRKLKVVFIDFPELMSQLQLGINNPDVRKRVDTSVEATKSCDLVIIDDLGAERDSDFTLSVIDTLLRSTENKNMIITTNLSGQDLPDKYGDRALSRMKMHGVGNSFSFNGITDHRG